MSDWKTRLQKNELWSYIKTIGEISEEDPDCLREYAAEVYEKWQHDLQKAIDCFKELADELKRIKKFYRKKT